MQDRKGQVQDRKGRMQDREEYRKGETSNAFRLAYVGQAGEAWTWKLLFGSAFAMPVPRQMTFAASTQSNPDLLPEKATSVEAGIYYNKDNLSIQLSPYMTWNSDVIDVVDGRFDNANKQQIMGVDIGLMKTFNPSWIRSIRTWVYLTWLPWAKQDSGNELCTNISTTDHILGNVDDDYEYGRECRVGDISRIKAWAGAQVNFTQSLTSTVLARFYSARPTVASNPVESVDAFATMDINLTYRNFVMDGLNLGLRVGNLFNAVYFHPGVNGATAGDTPGEMVMGEDGTESWQGSSGSYNSLIPQPARSIQITLQSDFD